MIAGLLAATAFVAPPASASGHGLGAPRHVHVALVRSKHVVLAWKAPQHTKAHAGKARRYVVKSGRRLWHCPRTRCVIGGLVNGRRYTFRVQAVQGHRHSHWSKAVHATPEAVPSAVRHLRVVSERDGRLTYSWSPPRGSFSPVTGYLVWWTGSRGYRRVTGTSKTITGVPNGDRIIFTVRAVNALGASHPGPSASNVSGVASGRPRTPSIVSVTGTNLAGGGTKAVVVSWSQVAPNGRGQTSYELRDNGTPVRCGGSTWTTDLSCTEQVPNDGSEHGFTVVAANAAGVPGRNTAVEGPVATHQSAPSARSTVAATGSPEGFSAATLTPTGVDGQATLAFTVGASHGKSGTVTCSGSFTCGSNDVGADGGSVTTTISGLTDGATSTATLTYCNGATSSDSGLGIEPCTTTTVSAVTYGPIGQPVPTVSADGNSVTAMATVDPHGAPVFVSIQDVDTGNTVASCTTGTGTSTCSGVESDLSYSTIYHYSITVVDASGHGRASTSISTAVGTGPPA